MADLTKTLNVRIKNKYDSYENWATAGVILEAGEIAIAHTTIDVKEGNATVKHPALLMKVGDGEKTFAQLPWLSAKAADVADWAKAEKKPDYEAGEITGIDAYIAAYVNDQMGISVDTDTKYQIVANGTNGFKLQSKGKTDATWADVAGSEFTVDFTAVTSRLGDLEALHGVGEDGKKKAVSAEISEAIEGLDLEGTYVKQDTGKGLSEANFTEAEKTKLAGIADNANNYEHATHTAYASGLYKVTVDSEGHVSAATSVQKSDITGLGIPAQDTTYGEATEETAGLMSAADKAKLDLIADEATKVIVDDTLSSTSTNAVENKAVTTAINALKGLHADGDDGTKKSVSAEINEAITGLKLADTYASKEVYEKYVEDNDKLVKANTDAIALLNKDDQTEGSVDYKVAQKIAEIVNENANGSVDTLNEIASWIVNDTTGAAKMAKDIQDQGIAIDNIKDGAAIDSFKDVEDKIGTLTKDTVVAEIEAAKEAAIEEASYDDEPVKGRLGKLEALHDTDEEGKFVTVSEEISAATEDIRGAMHTHDNGSVLDGIDADKVAAWDTAADRIGTADDILIFNCGTASTVI